jgi:ketosteroid isomerase-like protein
MSGDHHEPSAPVVAALGRLERALAAGDVAGAAACFVPDGALFGAGPGEVAHGSDELERAFAAVVDRGLRPRWEVDDAYVRRERDVLSFVADATVCVSVLGLRDRRHRRTVAGSLREVDGVQRFELFNGLDPVLGVVAQPAG